MIRAWLLLSLLLLACNSESTPPPPPPPPPAFTREFCLASLAIEDRIPGVYTIVSYPDSLRGAAGCGARWYFDAVTDAFVNGTGWLKVRDSVAVRASVHDSSGFPPRDTIIWWGPFLVPGYDVFAWTRDSASVLTFSDVVSAKNYWPIATATSVLQRWFTDSVVVSIRNCFNTDCTDRFFLTASWRRP